MHWPWNKKDVKDTSEGDVIKPRNQILAVPDDVTSKSKEKLDESNNLSDKERFKNSLKYDVSQNDGKAKLDRKSTSNAGDADFRSEREVADEKPIGKVAQKEDGGWEK